MIIRMNKEVERKEQKEKEGETELPVFRGKKKTEATKKE
jgi:hypothetical protein